MAAKPKKLSRPSAVSTIDEYLAPLSADTRAAAPKAEECITYQIPTFRLNGKGLVAFGAAKNHYSLYPMSSSTITAFKEQLTDFETSKGTVRFPFDKPLPVALVRKLVKAR